MKTRGTTSDLPEATIRTPQSVGMRFGLAGLLALILAGVFVAPASALTVTVVNTDGQGISSRYEPRLAATNGYGAPAGAVVSTICWTTGDPVGPNANRLWWYISYAGRQFYAPDRYLSTPYTATSTPSEPRCGSTSTSVATNVWVGSPVQGTWAPAGWFSHPEYPHWAMANNSNQRDWSVDIGAVAGAAVKLYAAPRYSEQTVTARIDQIGSACRSGYAAGGSFVQVGFYNGSGTRLGSASYGHINPSVTVGQVIPRWGSTLGTVGKYATSSCWDGSHVHFEMFSNGAGNYACWNKGYGRSYGYVLNPSNFLGYTGPGVGSVYAARCA